MKQALAFVYLAFGGILITSAITGEAVGELLTKGVTPAGKAKLHAQASGGHGGSEGVGSVPGEGGSSSGGSGGSVGGASGAPTSLPPSPSKIRVPKRLDMKRLEKLIQNGGPKGHLTPGGVKEILSGKVPLERAERELGL